jgi:hypothetical protein
MKHGNFLLALVIWNGDRHGTCISDEAQLVPFITQWAL